MNSLYVKDVNSYHVIVDGLHISVVKSFDVSVLDRLHVSVLNSLRVSVVLTVNNIPVL